MTNDEILRTKVGINCAQLVLLRYCEKFGMSKEIALKTTSCFGGGMMKGDICGAVSAAYVVLGLRFYDPQRSKSENMEILAQKQQIFDKQYLEIMKAQTCSELLGFNISKTYVSGVCETVCPNSMRTAIEILDEITT